MKSIVNKLNTIAREHAKTIRQHLDDQDFKAWFEIHGWNPTNTDNHVLIARQAVLNSAIRQVFTDLRLFETPFDFISVCEEITHEIREEATQSDLFNFWGQLYNTLIPQSKRRKIGQFWTDEHIADWMLAWLFQFQPDSLFDLGCGSGNFLIKAAQSLQESNQNVRLYGMDISPLMLNITQAAFSAEHLPKPELFADDYIKSIIPVNADALICNPPYTRHHHISPDTKDSLQSFLKTRLNAVASRKATMAFYFLMKIIAEITEGTHVAIIVPMEVLDARYGYSAKLTLCQRTSISGIIHFSPEMNAFHKVDVGASIIFFKKVESRDNLVRNITLKKLPTTNELLSCFNSMKDQELPFGSLVIQPQQELTKTTKWFSISAPKYGIEKWQHTGLVVPLKSLAKVMRGIATGANEFFALSTKEVEERSLESYVVRTIQRNREIQDIIIDEKAWSELSESGKRVWLLYLNSETNEFTPELADYLTLGEVKGYNKRSLLQTRKKWYFMEQREIPAIFFTILTRGNPRFILNKAGVRPLNMFSLIYPNPYIIQDECIEHLWVLLNSTFSISRLHSVSRTYGGNTLKVEPRELDNLPVINPLSLPDESKAKIKVMIQDFHCHRQIKSLVSEIDGLIAELLDSETLTQYKSPLPMQLQLFEEHKTYMSNTNEDGGE